MQWCFVFIVNRWRKIYRSSIARHSGLFKCLTVRTSLYLNCSGFARGRGWAHVELTDTLFDRFSVSPHPLTACRHFSGLIASSACAHKILGHADDVSKSLGWNDLTFPVLCFSGDWQICDWRYWRSATMQRTIPAAFECNWGTLDEGQWYGERELERWSLQQQRQRHKLRIW